MKHIRTRRSIAFTRFCVPKLQSGLYFRSIFIFIFVSKPIRKRNANFYILFLLQRKRAVPAHDSFCFTHYTYFTNGIFRLC